MKKNWLFTVLVGLVFVACSGEEKSADEKDKKENEEQQEEVVDASKDGPLIERIDEYVFAQDTSFESFNTMSTLPFLNMEKQIENQAFFHYDAEGVLKVVEEYNNTGDYQDIKRWYYKDDQVVCMTDIHVDYQDEAKWRQKKYYYENGELKSVYQFKDLDGEGSPIAMEEKVATTENAVNMMEFKGDYELSFSGFIEQPAGAFLVVKAKKSGFNSALIVDQGGADDFVKDLYDNQKKYIGKQLTVKWEAVQDPSNGLKQNAYRGGSFID